jgi:hypothetical protein
MLSIKLTRAAIYFSFFLEPDKTPCPAKTSGPGFFISFSTKTVLAGTLLAEKTAENSLSADIFP